MARYREWDLQCKVYVGNLGSSASKHEIECAFGKYGPLRNVWVARNPPGFAFVEFEDKRDAEDAVRSLDGTRCCGTRIRVEMSSGRTRRDDRSRRPRRSYRASSSMKLHDCNFCHRTSSNQPSTSSSTIKPSATIKSATKITTTTTTTAITTTKKTTTTTTKKVSSASSISSRLVRPLAVQVLQVVSYLLKLQPQPSPPMLRRLLQLLQSSTLSSALQQLQQRSMTSLKPLLLLLLLKSSDNTCSQLQHHVLKFILPT
ncbi:serine/arginine-rich splicing factor 2 isoform X1 [Toxorhynchites rutilus septentrionalis]|uniref:serine/arginine-rich splicing factor 2 isoform X1 n=1 Tax=Toxorhynchites rutilus septentrionalis TaxID=329112 RepID=UPI0024792D0D|nr:serine/arginine-rich splicing factor 2 isoform X1 [Toxorhynchites rutilus septentrionalis]XP_055621234.1 serine/arginine-rich splicing factor 2 isoform X1 [Toxorhynchites rutilus septentrionalis]